jgi:hypothetical protein
MVGPLACHRDSAFYVARKPCSSEPEASVGCIVARQRPCTAKGFIFVSMEGETRIANVIVTPDLYEWDRLVVKLENSGKSLMRRCFAAKSNKENGIVATRE